ncbi:MAG: hypothetical protein KKC19_02115 [Nanoarchaeota archaeon]|nr:hypothetical protein [Nanoarchaeota archaeon]
MEKKGSHVGIVISFGIFITFVIFTYVIISPAIESNENQNLIKNLKRNLVEEFSTEITIISIKTNTDSSNCARIGDFLTNFQIGKNLVATDSSGNIVTATYTGEHLNIYPEGGESFFRIYGSDTFAEIEGGPSCSTKKDLYGKFIKKENIVVTENIISIAQEYETDYAGLKERLHIPAINNFEFEFTDSEGEKIATEKKEISRTNIYIEEFPVEYIKESDVSRKVGILKVKVW